MAGGTGLEIRPKRSLQADADRRLCSMMMADKCSDCDRSKCSLFSKAPAAKSCYGRTYVDKPDGSGWLKKDAALSEELEAQLAANQSHLYFYWVNKAADRCGEVDAAPFHAEGPVRTKPHIAAPGVR